MPVAEPNQALVSVSGLHHHYGDHVALAGVDLQVSGGEIVAVLGRNGSGKTTLFRLLSTLMPVQTGQVLIDQIDVANDPIAARHRLGIIFQSPSLDAQLTVQENLYCQGALYGLGGVALRARCRQRLEQFELTERKDERCQTLSGGLKRRVELAKGLLHEPAVMLLDEPSTGLDPAARRSLWLTLQTLAEQGAAVLLTTHLMDEAAKASRVVLMEDGQKIADADPTEMCRELGGEVLRIEVIDPAIAQSKLEENCGLKTQVVGNTLHGTCSDHAQLGKIADCVGDQLQSISLGRPSLEDVFVAKTGKTLDAV